MTQLFRKSLVILSALLLVGIAEAQELNQLSSAISWRDNSTILMFKMDKNRPVYQEYNIYNGTFTEVDKPSEVSKPVVLIKEGDIYYTTAEGVQSRLTFTDAVEKNPELSPDGSRIAFTRDNDLYSIGIDGTDEIRYTNDGTELIMNGWASWVYYEEILGRGSRYKAFWWSPDSRTIAFMRFDDTDVPMFPIYNSSGHHGSITRTRYPKAGDSNPQVRVGFADVASGGVVWSDFDDKRDQYFGTPYWNSNSQELLVQWMDRQQKDYILYSVKRNDGVKNMVYQERQETWIDWLSQVRFGEKGFYFVRDFELWEQIYYQSYDGKELIRLTDGKNWGIRLQNFDEKSREIYFVARREASVRNDFYHLTWNKDMKRSAVKRLSQGEFNYTSVMLSPDKKHFVANISTVSKPTSSIIMSLARGGVAKPGEYVVFQDAAKDVDMSNIPVGEMIYITTADGYRLPATVIWPKNLDRNGSYPVIVSMYGGPNSGTVMDSWKNPGEESKFWYNRGLIQISIDHRASGHCGKEGLNFIHRNLGKQEIEDYNLWGEYLHSLPFVNKEKIGITGFSYGGTMTLLALTDGANYFRYGVAGGGVYDWMLYDSHYTERFMDTPQSNPQGYKSSSILNRVAKYRSESGSKLYITHGTSDDNVHFQNTLQLIDALQKSRKQFELMIYPGAMHGYRAEQSLHDRNATREFWLKNLF